MFIYYFIYFTIFFCTIFSLTLRNVDKWVFLLFCLIIGLLGGLRYNTGFDHEPYLDYYNDIPVIDLSNGFPYLVGNMEIGYFVFNLILKTFYLQSQFVLLIPSVFCILALYKITIVYNNKFLLVLLAYISFNLVHNHFSLVRQSICVGFTYMAISLYLKNSKPFLIFSLFCLSLLFHITSAFYILIFLLSKYLNPNKVFIKSLVIILFGFSLFKIDLALKFSIFLFNADILSIITHKYLDYGIIEYKISLSFYFYLIFNIIFVYFSFYLMLDNNISRKLISLVIYSSLMQVLFMTIFPSNYILWSRISIVTIVLQSLLFSRYITFLSNEKRVFYGLCYLLIMATFFIYNMTSMSYGLSPYKTIFNQYFE